MPEAPKRQCQRCQVWKLPEEFSANSSSRSCIKCAEQRREKRRQKRARPETTTTKDGTPVQFCTCCGCDRPLTEFSDSLRTCDRCRDFRGRSRRQDHGKITENSPVGEDILEMHSLQDIDLGDLPTEPQEIFGMDFSTLWSGKQPVVSHPRASVKNTLPQPTKQQLDVIVIPAPVESLITSQIEPADPSQKQRCTRCQVWKLPEAFAKSSHQCLKCTAKRKMKRQEAKARKANNRTDTNLTESNGSDDLILCGHSPRNSIECDTSIQPEDAVASTADIDLNWDLISNELNMLNPNGFENPPLHSSKDLSSKDGRLSTTNTTTSLDDSDSLTKAGSGTGTGMALQDTNDSCTKREHAAMGFGWTLSLTFAAVVSLPAMLFQHYRLAECWHDEASPASLSCIDHDWRLGHSDVDALIKAIGVASLVGSSACWCKLVNSPTEATTHQLDRFHDQVVASSRKIILCTSLMQSLQSLSSGDWVTASIPTAFFLLFWLSPISQPLYMHYLRLAAYVILPFRIALGCAMTFTPGAVLRPCLLALIHTSRTAHLADVLFINAVVVFCAPTPLACLFSVVATVLSCVVLKIKLNKLLPDQGSEVDDGVLSNSNEVEQLNDGSSKDDSSKDVSSKDGTSKDGTPSKDGTSKDGTSTDGSVSGRSSGDDECKEQAAVSYMPGILAALGVAAVLALYQPFHLPECWHREVSGALAQLQYYRYWPGSIITLSCTDTSWRLGNEHRPPDNLDKNYDTRWFLGYNSTELLAGACVIGSIMCWCKVLFCDVQHDLSQATKQQLVKFHDQFAAIVRMMALGICPVFAVHHLWNEDWTSAANQATWTFIFWASPPTHERFLLYRRVMCYIFLPCRAALGVYGFLPVWSPLPSSLAAPVAALLYTTMTEHLAEVFFILAVVLLCAPTSLVCIIAVPSLALSCAFLMVKLRKLEGLVEQIPVQAPGQQQTKQNFREIVASEFDRRSYDGNKVSTNSACFYCYLTRVVADLF